METGTQQQPTRERIETFVWFFIIVPLVLLAGLTVAGWHAPWSPLRIAGLAVMAAGLVLLTMARVTLGNSFSIAPEARKLVTNGLYSKVRNPVYVFSLFAIVGAALYFQILWLLLLLIPIIPMQVLRARAEARVLEAKFGEEYRQYRAKTWF